MGLRHPIQKHGCMRKKISFRWTLGDWRTLRGQNFNEHIHVFVMIYVYVHMGVFIYIYTPVDSRTHAETVSFRSNLYDWSRTTKRSRKGLRFYTPYMCMNILIPMYKDLHMYTYVFVCICLQCMYIWYIKLCMHVFMHKYVHI